MMKIFKIPYVKVNSVNNYFELKKQDREFKGLYRLPSALPSNFCKINKFKSEKTWEDFYKEIKQIYPIQYFFREYLFTLKNPLIYGYYHFVGWKLRDFKWALKLFLSPCFPRWRKVLPRHQYGNICDVMIDSNFALILDFYYEEVVDSIIDWESDDFHKTFLHELKKHVHWIEGEFAEKQKLLHQSLSKATNKLKWNDVGCFLYKETYKEYNDLEQQIFDSQTNIINWFVKNRQMFWT